MMSRAKLLAEIVRAAFRLMRNPEVRKFNRLVWQFAAGGDRLTPAEAAEAAAGTAVDEFAAGTSGAVRRVAKCLRGAAVKAATKEIEELD
jgi:hypothetical protein